MTIAKSEEAQSYRCHQETLAATVSDPAVFTVVRLEKSHPLYARGMRWRAMCGDSIKYNSSRTRLCEHVQRAKEWHGIEQIVAPDLHQRAMAEFLKRWETVEPDAK